jgi:methylase of polypeptide subunit release factors
MAIERLPTSIADACCGSGAILNVLAAAGHIVHGADIVDYGWRGNCTMIRDYLAEPVEMNGVAIVTNPPFRQAEAFIRKAIADGCHYHAWLFARTSSNP